MSIAGYIKDLFVNPDRYAKFWIALVGFGLSLLTAYFPTEQWIQPLVAFLTALGVFTVPNKRGV